jgi:thioredoxin 1
MSQFVAEVSDAGWEAEVLKSEHPVLVDFWAAWCGPCLALAPTIDEVAQQFQGSVKVLKLNVDQNPQTPAKYGIRGIPTLILYKGGEEVTRHVGVPNNALLSISEMIKQAL